MNNFKKQMNDPTFRAELRKNPTEALSRHGIPISADIQVEVLTNTNDIFYIAFPNSEIEYDDLSQLQAAINTVGSVGSAGSASTLGSLCTCIGSIGSVGSASTAGSVAIPANEVKL